VRCIERATADIDAGRLWKARDRLRGGFVTAPAHQELLNLLGDVLFRMGDLPEAARFWLLTDRRDERVMQAEAALRERCGHRASSLACALPVKASIGEYPERVQDWLRELRTEAEAEGQVDFDRRWGRPAAHVHGRASSRSILAVALGIGLVGTFMLGVVTVIWLVWSAIT
jgi:hypothetical protein